MGGGILLTRALIPTCLLAPRHIYIQVVWSGFHGGQGTPVVKYSVRLLCSS